MNQSQLVNAFGVSECKEGQTRHASSMHMYHKHGLLTVFSYGAHFPLAVRLSQNHEGEGAKSGLPMYLLNGDRHSSTTSAHQGFFMGERWHSEPRVSFSALAAAGVDPFGKDFRILDIRADEYGDEVDERADKEAYNTFKPPEHATVIVRGAPGERVKTWHLIGAILVMSNTVRYICALDEGSYFVSRLNAECWTNEVGQAFEELKPYVVRCAEREGRIVQRQGEWFFVPTSDVSPFTNRKADKRCPFFHKMFPLPRLDVRANRHVITRALIPGVVPGHNVKLAQDAEIYVQGFVRHWMPMDDRRSGQHRQFKLDSVCRAYLNTAVGSWSSTGKVD